MKLFFESRCLEPGCGRDAIPSTLRCASHIGSTLLELAEEYAVAVLLARAESEFSFLTAARFEGICSHLLRFEAWRRVEWLDRDALRLGDPRAPEVEFPLYLRVAVLSPRAREMVG